MQTHGKKNYKHNNLINKLCYACEFRNETMFECSSTTDLKDKLLMTNQDHLPLVIKIQTHFYSNDDEKDYKN